MPHWHAQSLQHLVVDILRLLPSVPRYLVVWVALQEEGGWSEKLDDDIRTEDNKFANVSLFHIGTYTGD